MGLFDHIISAVDNSHQQASPGQLSTILSTVQQLSDSYGTNPSTVQSVLSIVGNYVRSSLQQKRSTGGQEEAQALVNQYSGTYPNPQAVNTLFSPNQVEQIAAVVQERTGLNAGTIQAMLPILVPLVLNLLQSGAHTQNLQSGANPVLSGFLDADQDGDVDIADAMQLAGRYLSQR